MGMKLLILDDNHLILKALARVYTAEGFDVTTTDSVQDAVDKVRTHEFDALLSDWNLFRATAERAVREAMFAGLPVIIHTGDSNQESLDFFRDEGVPVLSKPSDAQRTAQWFRDQAENRPTS